MRFLNQQIIKNNSYAIILGVEVEEKEISFNNLLLLIKNRLITLIYEAVKKELSFGKSTKKEAIDDIRRLIYDKLTFDKRKNSTTMEGLAEEIMDSAEFVDIEADVWFSMKNIHLGHVTKDTKIKVEAYNKHIDKELYVSLSDVDLDEFLNAFDNLKNIDIQ